MSPEAQELMLRNENCRLRAYQDSGRVWTIGIGHTAGVQEGDTCTQQQALDWFAEEWAGFAAYVAKLARADSLPRELDAMTSLTYNIGKAGFAGSTVLVRHNLRAPAMAAAAFRLWNKDNGVVVLGLVNRRNREAAFYLGQPWKQLP